MSDITAVIGLVDEQEADAVVRDLHAHGLTDDEIDVLVPAAGRYRLADELLHEEAKGAERGALAGAMLGLVVGLVAGVGLVDAGTVIVMIAVGTTAFGALIGGMVGLSLNDRLDDDPVEFHEVASGSSERVVEVHSLHWRHRAHKVLERHGARFLTTSEPVAG